MAHDRAALGAFLRARRDRLTPSQAGMKAFPGPRRVPGLRKEELAMLAGVSPDYYSRLEQGRQASVSVEVLDALARALRLDRTEQMHLYALADPKPARRASGFAQRPDPGLLRIMTALDHLPVLILGHRGDVLARNALLPEVLGSSLEQGRSLARYMFLEPVARERILNWSDFAAATVATLRYEAGARPYDRELTRLITDLSGADADFARWWDDHAVLDYSSSVKRIRHPAAGDLAFGIEAVVLPQDPEQRLVVYTAEPHSHTARMLPLLASWHAVSS